MGTGHRHRCCTQRVRPWINQNANIVHFKRLGSRGVSRFIESLSMFLFKYIKNTAKQKHKEFGLNPDF